MIYKAYRFDDIQFLAELMIYTPSAWWGRANGLTNHPFLCYTKTNNTKGGRYMKKVNIIPLVAFLCLVLSCIIGLFDLCIELPLAFSVCNLLLVIIACILLLIFVIKQKKGKKWLGIFSVNTRQSKKHFERSAFCFGNDVCLRQMMTPLVHFMANIEIPFWEYQ